MKRWSPVSFTGKVYEFNRGVICIGERQTEKYSLDRGFFHHGEATIIAALSADGVRFSINESLIRGISSYSEKPFEAGVLVSKSNNVLIQLEGDEVLLFLPDSMNEYQALQLYKVIKPRLSFHFSLYHAGNVYDNISYKGIRTFVMEYMSYLKATRENNKYYK